MNEWKKCKLGDICSKVTSGGTPLTSNALYYNGIIPWLNTKEVKNCRIYETEKYISQLGLENSSAKWIEANSVIVAMYGATAGKVAINKIPLTTNQACCNLTINHEKADYNFIYYLILHNFETLEILATGAAQQNLNLNTIASLEITLPPLEEQRQIAAILSSIDDKIELLHEQNKTIEELAQTLFRHYFIENPNPSWQEKPLSDFGNIICGKTPSKKVDEYYNGNIPFIKIPDMHGSIFVFKTNEYLSELGSQTQINKFIPKKSICISCIATVGVVSMNAFESHTNQQINSIIPKKEHYRYFLYLYMKHLYDYLQSMASGGTATANLNTRDFSNIHILMPDEEMMINFNDKTSEYFDKIFKNLEQIQTLENMRDILIPKLLNGGRKINN